MQWLRSKSGQAKTAGNHFAGAFGWDRSPLRSRVSGRRFLYR